MLALPESDPQREEAIRLLVTWKIELQGNPRLEQSERELSMTLSQAFLEWEAKVEQRGEQRGEQRSRQEIARNLLELQMPVEQVARLTGLSVEQVQQLSNNPSS